MSSSCSFYHCEKYQCDSERPSNSEMNICFGWDTFISNWERKIHFFRLKFMIIHLMNCWLCFFKCGSYSKYRSRVFLDHSTKKSGKWLRRMDSKKEKELSHSDKEGELGETEWCSGGKSDSSVLRIWARKERAIRCDWWASQETNEDRRERGLATENIQREMELRIIERYLDLHLDAFRYNAVSITVFPQV